MKKKKFIRKNNAVVGVIEALLLIGLVVIIISTIQLYYVPQIMEQKEEEHMNEVENQISYLKSMIDIQSMTKEDVPISSPLTLGSRKLPYFVTSGAFGDFRINDRYKVESKITTNPNIAPIDYPNGIPLTSIKYDAYNTYVDDQTYVLEGGCIFNLPESGGKIVKILPALTVEDNSKINVYYYVPILISIPGKNVTSGYKNCLIRTNYSGNDTYSGDFSGFNQYIRFYTDYVNAWYESFNELFEEELVKGYVNVSKDPSQPPLYVEITPESGRTIHLEIETAFIGVQTGIGIVDID